MSSPLAGTVAAITDDGVALPSPSERVGSDDIRNVSFRMSQPRDRIDACLSSADLLVVSLRDTRPLPATIPNKVQAALSAARPNPAFTAGDAAELFARSASGRGRSRPATQRADEMAVGTLRRASGEQVDALDAEAAAAASGPCPRKRGCAASKRGWCGDDRDGGVQYGGGVPVEVRTHATIRAGVRRDSRDRRHEHLDEERQSS